MSRQQQEAEVFHLFGQFVVPFAVCSCLVLSSACWVCVPECIPELSRQVLSSSGPLSTGTTAAAAMSDLSQTFPLLAPHVCASLTVSTDYLIIDLKAAFGLPTREFPSILLNLPGL